MGILIVFNLKQNNKEENKLKNAINNVYDSVLYIESYKHDKLISSGSGFIYKINDKAYIITNNHVIEESDEISDAMKYTGANEDITTSSDIQYIYPFATNDFEK